MSAHESVGELVHLLGQVAVEGWERDVRDKACAALERLQAELAEAQQFIRERLAVECRCDELAARLASLQAENHDYDRKLDETITERDKYQNALADAEDALRHYAALAATNTGAASDSGKPAKEAGSL